MGVTITRRKSENKDENKNQNYGSVDYKTCQCRGNFLSAWPSQMMDILRQKKNAVPENILIVVNQSWKFRITYFRSNMSLILSIHYLAVQLRVQHLMSILLRICFGEALFIKHHLKLSQGKKGPHYLLVYATWINLLFLSSRKMDVHEE